MPNANFYSAIINPSANGGETISLNATDDQLVIVAQCYVSHDNSMNLSTVEGFDIAMEELRRKVAKEDLDEQACHTAEVQTHRSIFIVTRLVVNQDGFMYIHLIDCSCDEDEVLATVGGFSFVDFDAAYERICKQYFVEVE